MDGFVDALVARADWVAARAANRLAGIHTHRRISHGFSPRLARAKHLALLRKHYETLRAHEHTQQPSVRFHVVVRSGSEHGDDHLLGVLGSLLLQTHPDWQVSILGPGGTTVSALKRLVPDQVVGDEGDLDWAGLFAIIQSTPADYVLVLDGADRLLPSAMSDFARRIRQTGFPDVLYGDESFVGPGGEQSLELKPKWSPLLQLQANYVGRSVIFRVSALRQLTLGTSDDLAEFGYLATIKLAGLHPGPELVYQPTLQCRTDTPPVSVGTIQASAAQWGVILSTPDDLMSRDVDFVVPDPLPSVTVVIPNRDAPQLLQRCLASLELLHYPELSAVIVDNGSTDSATLALYDSRPGWVDVIYDPGDFNFARLSNAGVAAAVGEYALLLNNDTESEATDWLHRLVAVASLPGVGVVGPQLRYPDGHIQHAGVVGLGTQGVGHEHVGALPEQVDDRHAREVLAVTGACLLVRREIYESIGGLDEAVLYTAGGDIELCLRVRELGMSVVYEPRAVLTHHESKTRGRGFEAFERVSLMERWATELTVEPYRNPRLAQSTRRQHLATELVPVVPAEVLERWCRAGRIS